MLITAALAALALAAPAAAPAKTTNLVTYSKSAAQPGVVQRLEVRTDGRAIVRVPGTATKRRQLKTTTMKRLRRLLADAHLERPLPSPAIECADCYVYKVSYRGHRVTVLEIAIPERVRALMAELKRIAGGGR